jgi:hypothetical protein
MMRTRAAIIFIILGWVLAFNASGEALPRAREAPPRAGIELGGSVSDELGQPVVGAVVSVFGKNLADGALTAVTDASGQFQLESVPPGLYRLRAYLSGFLPSSYAKVIIEEGVEQVGAVLMSLAALDAEEASDEASNNSGNNSGPGRKRTLAELKWLVAHGDRNVLKSDDWELPVASLERPEPENETETATLSADEPSLEIRGEFGVRAAAYDQGLDEFPGGGAGLDARLAYARLHIPTKDDGHWLVSAQVLESALSSWAGRADYVKGNLAGHTLNAGVTYGNFLYGDLEDFRPPEAALTHRSGGQRSTEWFGSVYASDSFALGSASINAGMAYEYFGFLSKSGYVAPRVEVTQPLGETGRTVVRGAVDYRVLAPGGEDIGLLSRVAYGDLYGPSRSAGSSLRAESTARFQLGLERQLTSRTRIGVRMFQENAHDQLVKVYTRATLERVGAGHFTLGNKGDFRTRGVGLTLSQSFGALEGSIGYTFGMGRALSHRLVGLRSPAEEEIHDVTTAVATSIVRTRTRLTARYRFVSHPTFAASRDGFAPGTTQDSRFNIQVFQALPFAGWNGTSWELMVAVRNLFYGDVENTSVLDEISVIDAPRRVLGGVTVRF